MADGFLPHVEVVTYWDLTEHFDVPDAEALLATAPTKWWASSRRPSSTTEAGSKDEGTTT